MAIERISIGKGRSPKGITDRIMKRILDNIRDNLEVDEKQVASYATRLIRKAYIQGIKYATKNLIGKPSPTGTGKASFGIYGMASQLERVAPRFAVNPGPIDGMVKWPALSMDTMERKGNNQFFKDNLDLQNYLIDNAGAIASKTGIVKVVSRNAKGRIMKKTDKVTIANLYIRVMPNVSPALLPGLDNNDIGQVDKTQAFERLLINDSDILNKLYGPGPGRGNKEKSSDRQRPLLQPVFTFWTRYYIPTAIRKAFLGATKLDNSQ